MKEYIPTATIPPFGRKDSRASWIKMSQKMHVYDAIVEVGEKGLGSREISERTKIIVERVRLYLSELRRAGFIAIKGGPVDVAKLSAQDAAFYALEILELAMTSKAKEVLLGKGPEDKKNEMRRSFLKYQKIKAMALRAPTEGEVASALRFSLIELIKMVYN